MKFETKIARDPNSNFLYLLDDFKFEGNLKELKTAMMIFGLLSPKEVKIVDNVI